MNADYAHEVEAQRPTDTPLGGPNLSQVVAIKNLLRQGHTIRNMSFNSSTAVVYLELDDSDAECVITRHGEIRRNVGWSTIGNRNGLY
jgi:hypothetical protein